MLAMLSSETPSEFNNSVYPIVGRQLEDANER